MTQSKNQVWYHCGKCGSLYEAPFTHDESRVCGVCRKNPRTGVWPAADNSQKDEKTDAAGFSKKPETLVEDSGRRAVRKKRRANVMLKVVVIWTFIMLLAVWIRHDRTKTAEALAEREKVASRMTKGTLADQTVATLNEVLPDCHRALGGFLTAGTPEGRNQYVVDPIETAGKMAVFYSRNPFPKVDPAKLQRIDQQLLNVGGTRMVVTRWKEKDGLEFDAVFRKNSGTWRLDWSHFSQFSEYPWTLFLAGEGPDEAEFRLLALQRLSESESERVGSRLIFTMAAPVFGKGAETGMQSPDFVIDRRSDEGLLISAAFESRTRNERPFGQTMEPLWGEALVPVHVRVKRSELGGIRTFTLEEVIACHWLDSENPGYDLKELQDDLFGN